jgi:transposase-like protein
MMLDGLEIAGRVHVVALGITTEGVKVPLGLWEGSTENATLARSLLAGLVDRGLDPGQAILFVLDGGKALRRAIKDVFGEHALVHRCHRHKECPIEAAQQAWRPNNPWHQLYRDVKERCGGKGHGDITNAASTARRALTYAATVGLRGKPVGVKRWRPPGW